VAPVIRPDTRHVEHVIMPTHREIVIDIQTVGGDELAETVLARDPVDREAPPWSSLDLSPDCPRLP